MPRSEVVRVRCNETEKKEILRQASELGYDNYSDFLRALVFDFDTVAFKKQWKKGKI